MTEGRGQAGFTLIELLVVIAMVAVLSLALGLSPAARGGLAGGTPSRAAARLAAEIETARDAALFSRTPRALRPERDGWRILAPDPQTGAWHEHSTAVFAGLRFGWTIKGRALVTGPSGAARLVFLPDRRATGFSVSIARGTRRAVCRIEHSAPLACDEG